MSPNRFPFYEAPRFQPTGLEQVDKALESWRQDWSNTYSRNLFEAERIPDAFSAVTTATQLLNSSVFSSYFGLSAGFQGNEQCLVIASVQMLSTGLGNAVTCDHTLRITFPSGAQQTLSSMTASLAQQTSVAVVATVTGHWRVSPRIQVGGLHTFDVMVRRRNAGVASAAQEGVLTVFIF